MRKARFWAEGRLFQGLLEGEELVTPEGRRFPAAAVRWDLPFTPGKVLGLALNYRDHADELGLSLPQEPALFWKPNNALLPHKEPVVRPRGVNKLHGEVELAVVIGKRARKLRPEEAMEYVLGYTIANDLVAREYVTNTFRPPIRAKGHDTFGPLGPVLVTAEEIPDPHNLRLTAYVNDTLCQQGSTANMVLSIPEILAYVTSFMTLEPLDVILTGTPPGIGFVQGGDVMRVCIEGIGVLENPVVEEA